MKKLLLALLFLPTFSIAGERITTQLYCDDTEAIVKSLKDTHHEEPFLLGIANDLAESLMTFWLNPVTKSWTILATKDNISCVVGVGNKIQVIPLKRKINI